MTGGDGPLETLAWTRTRRTSGSWRVRPRLLLDGELLIYPTDTLYALGGRALDARSGAAACAPPRDATRPSRCPLIAADLEQVAALSAGVPAAASGAGGPVLAGAADAGAAACGRRAGRGHGGHRHGRGARARRCALARALCERRRPAHLDLRQPLRRAGRRDLRGGGRAGGRARRALALDGGPGPAGAVDHRGPARGPAAPDARGRRALERRAGNPGG